MKISRNIVFILGALFLGLGLSTGKAVQAVSKVENSPKVSVPDANSPLATRQAESSDNIEEAGPSIIYSTHEKNVGWLSSVADGVTSGEITNQADIESVKISLKNIQPGEGGVAYRVQSRNVGWQGDSTDGQAAGATGKNLPLETIQMHLTGKIAESYSIFYRVYVNNQGWTKFSKDNQLAGTVGMAWSIQAIQIQVRPKTAVAPTDDPQAHFSSLALPKLSYQVQSRNIGWGKVADAGEIAGTVGRALRAEAFKASIENPTTGLSGGISYEAHVQNKGWMTVSQDGEVAGTVGQALQLEAVRIKLTGQLADYFSVYYRSHVSKIGWTKYTKDDQISGSIGANLPIEAIQAIIVPKGNQAPSQKSDANYTFLNKPNISYQAHSATIGWGTIVREGEIAGTVGRNLQLEAMRASISELTSGENGSVEYQVHVQDQGWKPVSKDNQIGGTTGLDLHAEALTMALKGEVAKYYDIWYQVQVQNYGWLGWAKNGAIAGTTGLNRQAEAYRIRIVSKNASAPGSTKNAHIIGQSGWKSVSGKLRYYNAATNSYTKNFSLKYYSQLDKRWSGRTYGSYNFGKTGCGQASIAMIISGFGINVTPAMAADYSHKYGSFDTAREVGSAQSDLTIVADHFGVSWRVMKTQAELGSYLAKGYPATVCLDLGGGVRHIVVLTGNSGGVTTVSDPWNGLLFSGRHSIAQIWSKLSWKADNRNKGASAAVVYIAK